MTHLFRGNSQGEILDASGQVVGRIVPVEPTEAMIDSPRSMFSALDLGNKSCDDVREHMRRYDGHVDALPDWLEKPYHFTKAGKAIVVYQRMLSAAPTDWSSVAVRVPEKFMRSDNASEQQFAEGWNQAIDAITEAK